MSDLVQTRGVPGFRDHLRIRERIVQLDLPDHGRVRERCSVFSSRQDGAFVEPESVHVHPVHPVPQAVHDELLRDRVIGVERIAHAAVVRVDGGVARIEQIERAVVDAPE